MAMEVRIHYVATKLPNQLDLKMDGAGALGPQAIPRVRTERVQLWAHPQQISIDTKKGEETHVYYQITMD